MLRYSTTCKSYTKMKWNEYGIICYYIMVTKIVLVL